MSKKDISVSITFQESTEIHENNPSFLKLFQLLHLHKQLSFGKQYKHYLNILKQVSVNRKKRKCFDKTNFSYLLGHIR